MQISYRMQLLARLHFTVKEEMIIMQEWLHTCSCDCNNFHSVSVEKSHLDGSTDTLKIYVKDGKSRLHYPNHSIAIASVGVYLPACNHLRKTNKNISKLCYQFNDSISHKRLTTTS